MKNTKKKIACFALASALVIPGVMGLAGCEKKHTHAFNSDPFYEVVLEGESKIARSWRECSCGAEDAHKKVDNAVIVTPSNAQEKMDQNINGKVVIFDKDDNGNGVYATPIDFRPTRDTAKVYTSIDKDSEVTDLTTLKSNTLYTYERNWENIIFTAVEGVDFKSGFVFNSAKISSTVVGDFDHITYDAVKNMNLSESAGYYSLMSVSNVTFTRINLTGKYGRITIRTALQNGIIEDINVNNCSFITDEVVKETTLYAAIFTSTNNTEAYALKNLVAKNNKIDGHFQGVTAWGSNGATICDNEITNTIHNGIAIQSAGSVLFSGDYLISGNKITKVLGDVTDENTSDELWRENGDRAIRFGSGTGIEENKNSNITITNNTFSYCYNQAIASNTLTNYNVKVYNNYYNEIKLQELSGEKTSIIIYVVAPSA